MIQAFDAPFQGDVEHIYLNIIEVSVHRSDADSSADSTGGWIVLSDADTTIDFLELVNGQMATLLEEELEIGQYSQLRLLLGDSSAIVVDGTSHELKIPSGSQSGVKLNLGFSIEADEIVEIYLDFDAARSISKHPQQDRCAVCRVSTETLRAFATSSRDANANSIALADARGILSHGRYRPRPFMTADRGVVRRASVESVQVGSADAAMRNLDDGLPGLRDRSRELHEFDLFMSCNQPDLHRHPPNANARA